MMPSGMLFTVTNTNDSGTGSLRAAILGSNGSPGGNTIGFSITESGVQTISLMSALPSIMEPVDIVGTTGSSGQPLIQLDGTNAGSDAIGLNLVSGSAGSTISGLIIDNFTNAGIELESTGNTVFGSYIGTNAAGSAAGSQPMGYGFVVTAASNTIGGTTVGAGDVISGNTGAGILILGSAATGNTVEGNKIGTDVTGTVAVANGYGVDLDVAPDNTIGGTVSGSANLISGNTNYGVLVGGSSSSGNLVAGNLIGTDITGTVALANGNDGVYISDAPDNTIGGPAAGDGNVISGNLGGGIVLYDSVATLIEGNKIGTDASGTTALGNSGSGILVYGGGSGNTIGGTAAGAGNLISYIYLSGTSQNTVQGNLIGTDITGTVALSPTTPSQGIILGDAAENLIGGTIAGAGNVIGGESTGILLFAGSTANLVEANFVGTNSSGSSSLGNRGDGIAVSDASDNTIGGTTTGAGNVVSGNQSDGIYISGSSGTVVQGNKIGTDVTGEVALPNEGPGILTQDGSGNTIGGAAFGAGNLISGNTGDGIDIIDDTGDVVAGNMIGTDVTGTVALGNNGVGVYVVLGASANTIGGTAAGAGNIISGNAEQGILFDGAGVTGNVVEGNYIGTNLTGTAAVANTGDGVQITGGATNNTVGGITATPGTGAGNLISGNTGNGVEVSGAGTNGNVVAGNLIGTNAAGDASVANYDGVKIDGSASGNTIGGIASTGNVVSGNSQYGVFVTDAGTDGNVVAGNYIGTDASGTAPLTNTYYGVAVAYGSNNVIGLPGAGNVVAATVDYSGITTYFASGTVIQANRIGTTADGMAVLPGLYSSNGIFVVSSPDTLVGGTQPGSANVVSIAAWNSGFLSYIVPVGGFPWVADGIDLENYESANGCAGTVVEGNLIGTNATGTLILGNPQFGIGLVDVSNVTVGGTAAGSANVIAGNSEGGIALLSGPIPLFGPSSATDYGSSNDLIEGNYIGVNFDSQGNLISGLGNGGPLPGLTGATESGILINDPTDPLQTSSGNTIGGTAAGAANIISGNIGGGIVFAGGSVTGNLVQGNLIGTNLQGTAAIANTGDGVQITGGATTNTIGGTTAGAGNVIAFNTGVGVQVGSSPTDTSTGDAILENSIFANSELGIGLGGSSVVQNDSDGHTGPNLFQDFPVISSVITSGGTTTIDGTITEAANTTYRIEFFSNETADPSGDGQGQTFLTFVDVMTNGSGTGTFSVVTPSPLSAGLYVDATATDPAGNTSEFSQDLLVAMAGGPTYYTVNLTSDTGAARARMPTPAILRATCSGRSNRPTPIPIQTAASSTSTLWSSGQRQTITLSSTLELSETAGPEVIDASGVVGSVTISGNNAVGIFQVDSGVVASFTDLTIADGRATSSGGIFSNGTITVTGCTISDNSVPGGNGGGIWSSGTATITDSMILDNSAPHDFGGGIDNSGTMTITDSLVENNTARAGGGIWNLGHLTITNSTISDNLSTFGGGIWNNAGAGATLTAENCTFDGDQASLGTHDRGSNGGGAIFNSGSSRAGVGPMYLFDCRFTGNFARTTGGAISEASGGIGSISGCTFADNSAGSHGGGGISVLSGVLTITNSTLVGNSTSGPGGGINVADGCTLTADDDTIVGNSASAGGGIDNSGTVTLVNVTIANNSATTAGSGGGLGGAAGTYALYNTIVAQDTAGGAADDIGGTDSFTGKYNLIGVDNTGSFTNGVNGNIVGRAYVGLGVLANNGGPTETIGLLPTSPAVFDGSTRSRASRCPLPTARRGVARWVGFDRVVCLPDCRARRVLHGHHHGRLGRRLAASRDRGGRRVVGRVRDRLRYSDERSGIQSDDEHLDDRRGLGAAGLDRVDDDRLLQRAGLESGQRKPSHCLDGHKRRPGK